MIEHKNDIKYWSPILFNLIFCFDIDLDASIWNLMREAAKKSNRVYVGKYIKKRARFEQERKPTAEHLEIYEDYTKSCSFYSAKMKRIRPRYKADEIDIDEEDSKEACGKLFPSFSGQTGGIWIQRCLHHSIALGVHVVPISEGLNDPFSAIYCHWKEAPKTCVADYNCRFHSYATRREPVFWQCTIIVNDECHGGGAHKACSEAYNIKVYKNLDDEVFSTMNDAGSEERNRPINRIKESARYFRKGIFMIVAIHLLDMDNRYYERKWLGLAKNDV